MLSTSSDSSSEEHKYSLRYLALSMKFIETDEVHPGLSEISSVGGSVVMVAGDRSEGKSSMVLDERGSSEAEIGRESSKEVGSSEKMESSKRE